MPCFGSCFWNSHDVSGTALEAGAGGRSGAAGIPVYSSLMGRFSLCIWLFSLFFWSTVPLCLALWCCQVKQSVRWHFSGHQHRLVRSGWCVPWSVFQVGVWFHLCTRVQGPDRMLSRIWPHTSYLSASCLSGVRGLSVECSRVYGTHWHRVIRMFLTSLSDKPCTYGRPMEGGLVLPVLADVL